MFDRDAFYASFELATKRCIAFARSFVTNHLPDDVVFDFAAACRASPPGEPIKFLGGRLLQPTQLWGVEPARARKYLWVDGKVPAWVNFMVHAADDVATRVLVMVA